MAKRRSKHKKILITVIVIAAVAVGGALYVKARQKSSMPNHTSQSKASTNSQSSANQSGGVIDNNAGKGSASSNTTPTPPSAAPTSSNSGVITLTSPASGATIGNGTAVTGTAQGLAQVQYRIEGSAGTDAATGSLTVVNGSFSGTITGLPSNLSDTSGTLEVYDYKNGNGPEENGAKLNVSFR